MVNLKLIRPEHLWYAVGIIATDGNLSPDKRHIAITSKDICFLQELSLVLGLDCKIGRKSSGSNKDKIYGVLQFSDVNFYKYLLSLGLTPKKSLTLSKLKIPQIRFTDFLRGVIDGDGNIRNWTHPQNGNEQWSLRIVSASEKFSGWLFKQIQDNFRVLGKIYGYRRGPKGNMLYTLKFGKVASKLILAKTYYPGCFSLRRKFDLAQNCLNSAVGWHKYADMVIL